MRRRAIVHHFEQILIARFLDALVNLIRHLAAGVSRRGE